MSYDATNGDMLDDEAQSGPHRLGTVAVTIGFRVVGAFALVLVLLLALGVSGFVAIRSIALEARLVEAGAEAGVTHTEFNVQLRSTLSRAKLYAASEDAKDLDSLRGAVAELKIADAKLDVRQPLPGSVSAATLREQTGRYLRSLDAIVALIDARRTHSLEMRQALLKSQALALEAAQRIGADPIRTPSALILLNGIGASGISAQRYRRSRDPTDIETARRWASAARDAFGRLMAAAPAGDSQMGELLGQLAAAMTALDTAFIGMEEATSGFAAAYPRWDADAQHLLADGVKSRMADVTAQTDAARRMLAVIAKAAVFDVVATSLAIASGIILAFALVRTIARPLSAITEAMRGLAGGALDTAIPSADRRDEIGAMAKAVAVFQGGLVKVGVMDAEKETERAERRARLAAMEELNHAFEREVSLHTASLADAAVEMTRSAKALLDTAARTSRKCGLVGSAVGEASSGVRHVASGTEEVAAAVLDVGRRVSTSAQAARDASARAREADTTVRALLTGARRIGEIVGVVGSIAEETNLLALNATIEAARAGQAGRGFAVVAGEVKQLSVATSRATEEIGAYISGVQDAMKSAATTLEAIGLSVHDMGENATRIANAVDEQSASVERITRNAGLAAAGTENIRLNIADVEADAACTDQAARTMLASAELVASRAEAMRERVSVYLEQTRRA